MTVGVNQAMVHMKFGWGSTQGIDVVNVWQPGSWTGFNPDDPIFTGGGGGVYTGPVYSLVSTDWDANGIAGAAMIDGPFTGFKMRISM